MEGSMTIRLEEDRGTLG